MQKTATARSVDPSMVMTPTFTCERCGDVGFVQLDVPLGHPEFGRARLCSCQADNPAALAVWAGIPSGYSRHRLKTFPKQGERFKRAAQEWVITRAYLNLLICGPNGVGKTGLATGVLIELILRGNRCLFLECAEVVAFYRDEAGPDDRPLVALKWRDAFDVPILLLDDLLVPARSGGGEWVSNRARERFTDLIAYRHDRSLTMIVTANESPEELEATLGERIWQRLSGDALVLDMAKARSLRGHGNRVA